MAVEDCGRGTCMIDEKDGTRDGECGKLTWVMGTPIDGGLGWVDTGMEAGMARTDAGWEDISGGAEESSEMTGPVVGSCGMPP